MAANIDPALKASQRSGMRSTQSYNTPYVDSATSDLAPTPWDQSPSNGQIRPPAEHQQTQFNFEGFEDFDGLAGPYGFTENNPLPHDSLSPMPRNANVYQHTFAQTDMNSEQLYGFPPVPSHSYGQSNAFGQLAQTVHPEHFSHSPFQQEPAYTDGESAYRPSFYSSPPTQGITNPYYTSVPLQEGAASSTFHLNQLNLENHFPAVQPMLAEETKPAITTGHGAWSERFRDSHEASRQLSEGRNGWKPKCQDPWYPANKGDQLAPYAKLLYDAMVDTSECTWQQDGQDDRNSERLWVEGTLNQYDIEARAWQVAAEARDLHAYGSRMWVAPGCKSRNQMKDSTLSFKERIAFMCETLMRMKGLCMEVMNGYKHDILANGPKKYLQRHDGNLKGNSRKKEQIEIGKIAIAKRGDHVLAGIDDKEIKDTNNTPYGRPARPKAAVRPRGGPALTIHTSRSAGSNFQAGTTPVLGVSGTKRGRSPSSSESLSPKKLKRSSP